MHKFLQWLKDGALVLCCLAAALLALALMLGSLLRPRALVVSSPAAQTGSEL